MDHVVIPLGPDHAGAARAVISDLSATVTASRTEDLATGPVPHAPQGADPHVTVVAFGGLSYGDAVKAVTAAAQDLAPFVVRAHGWGLFTGEKETQLCLFVPVVRTRELDELHRRVYEALERAGATISGQTARETWTPHIALLDRDLDAPGLARIATHVAYQPHPSWNVPVEELGVTGPGSDPGGGRTTVTLSGRSAPGHATAP